MDLTQVDLSETSIVTILRYRVIIDQNLSKFLVNWCQSISSLKGYSDLSLLALVDHFSKLVSRQRSNHAKFKGRIGQRSEIERLQIGLVLGAIIQINL